MDMVSFAEMSLTHVPSYAGMTRDAAWSSRQPRLEQSLLEQLQTTLDLKQQLQLFSMAAGKILPLTSLCLQSAVGDFTAAGSYSGQYEYRSMLILQDQCLAELIYHAEAPIGPLPQRELLDLETQWLYPLRNALLVARLQQLALRDTLTGLGNRRYFDENLQKLLQLSARKQQPCALILLDLDNFKHTNDHYGHHAGDEVLLAVADAMRQTLRSSDSLFRFGGDEFAVLLNADDCANTDAVAQRIVKGIFAHHICQQFGISASAGFAIGQQSDNPQTLFQRADAALYAAKHGGKNQVRAAADASL
jgi:diguanylate cyclase (GGDEF)-like protein